MLRQQLRPGERGQALVEFVVIFPLLFFLFISMIDFGLALDRRLTLQHAVREGARYAAVTDDAALIRERTANQAIGDVDPADIDICYVDVNGTGGPGQVGDGVRVSTDYTWGLPLVGPALSGLFGGSVGQIDMSPSGTARLERSIPGAVSC